MRAYRTIIVIAVLLTFPMSAFAIEPSASVKVTQVLKTTTSWDNKQIVYPEGKAEVTGLVVEIAPGGETGWHLHPVPSFAMILEGTLEVTLKDGKVKRLQSGDALAEVMNTLHNGRNVGTVPVKLIVFYAGVQGQAVTEKKAGDKP